MLLPDNINPEITYHYRGSLVIEQLRKEDSQQLLSLYEKVKVLNDMSFSTFLLCLDWLYLIDAAYVDEKGLVGLCS